MAKKSKTIFMCTECGYESPKWMGQCICGAWNSFVEEKEAVAPQGARGITRTEGRQNAARLREITSGNYSRMDTGVGELNRVLGGGLVGGSLTLISGEPGIGKSTIIIQVAANISSSLGPVLYISGEESEEQIKMRAERVCKDIPENLFVLSETNMDLVEGLCEQIKPRFLVIDSIQTMFTDEITSAPGSVSQVRACGNMLMKLGKTKGIPIFIVAHVTKAGELAGPKIVEHLVDTVLNFTGERDQELRILRAFKSRFGTTREIGAFTMEEEGLVEVENLSSSLLSGSNAGEEGAMISAVYEGSRPVMFEVQALATACNVGFPRRTAVGIDNQRLSMILAVLEKKAGVFTSNFDIYTNVVGGLRPDGTSMDLAIALAIYSSIRGKRVREVTLAIGEVGLTGELRSVQNAEQIVLESIRMGYRQILIPHKNYEKLRNKNFGEGVKVLGIRNIREALRIFS